MTTTTMCTGTLTITGELDDDARKNVGRAGAVIEALATEIDPEALSRTDMARRFSQVAKELGAGTADRYRAGPVVVRARATEWAYSAELHRNDVPVATVTLDGRWQAAVRRE